MNISCIVATDLYGGIGKNGKMPWHISSELKHFKEVTLGKPVIMGRKTFESLGGPLPRRVNIVISSKPVPGVLNVTSASGALTAAADVWDHKKVHPEDRETIIIGGAETYKAFDSLINRVYITRVAETYDVDTYFDDSFIFGIDVPKDTWKKVKKEYVDATETDPAYVKYVYEKNQQLLKL